MESIVAAVAALFVVLGLLSGFLRRTPLTAPMLALAAGVLLGPVAGSSPRRWTRAACCCWQS